MMHTRLCLQGSFPYKALVAYQRCVDNPTMNYEVGISACAKALIY
jgi:hypothetical protein